MNNFQKMKYGLYFFTGVFCIVNLFLWWNLFTILLCIGGILLCAYSFVCFRQQQNILAKLPKPFQYVCRVCVTTFIVSFLLIETLVIINGVKKDDVKPDYIVVLGAAIKGDQPSKALRYRLEEAYDCYIQYPNVKIICSGGKASDKKYSEAEVMKKYLVKLGVSKKQILLEDNSFSTYENLRNSYALVDNKDASFLIVTNNFHAFRAKYIANKIGMKAYCSPSQKLYKGFTANYIREYFSVLKAVFLN
ncbi:vancomycin permeability regulator SanA [Breznakia sp. PF5-3]|uniref:YdcF family protein n=1 Tax=unclassified Breznakia TaxID=2623764 RepID=UPI00240618DE|nr:MULTISPECIES: YdcF family protein [unclassified Breznakia]MDF9824172.1 vancomycin permeability regulator SanA [Breznakia sp. PM6-1]MDF9834970.1 vancomycin permeability regulator SanA [Breznakia sp. PF5-3]MDF9837161.1 vancomycin permeability regulator SanA [Breznakia sp. PFB2-8]MDF9859151.1 vancomycin permeability regulator SanA [Breznakia sp. PH5-24]